MTVQELINELEGANPDAEVRIAQQPQWPFEYDINEVFDMGNYDPRADFEVYRADDGWYIGRDDGDEGGPFETDDEAEEAISKLLSKSGADESVVYLSEGRQLGYLPGAAAKALGWR